LKIFLLIGLDFSFIVDEQTNAYAVPYIWHAINIRQTTVIFFSVLVWLQVFWQANTLSKVFSNI